MKGKERIERVQWPRKGLRRSKMLTYSNYNRKVVLCQCARQIECADIALSNCIGWIGHSEVGPLTACVQQSTDQTHHRYLLRRVVRSGYHPTFLILTPLSLSRLVYVFSVDASDYSSALNKFSTSL
jgi:hypothetical protein